MANTISMFHDYCRVVLHLPTHTPYEKFAANEIIDKFKTRFVGSTFTGTSQSVFTGAWLDKSVKPAVSYEDSVALLLIDMPLSAATHNRQLGRNMDIIRAYAFARYLKAGMPQAEIWIVATPIMVRLSLPHPSARQASAAVV